MKNCLTYFLVFLILIQLINSTTILETIKIHESVQNTENSKSMVISRKQVGYMDKFPDSLNSNMAFGKYEIGSKIWYFQRLYDINKSTTSKFSYDMYFVVPTQMKEVYVSLKMPIKIRGNSKNGNFYPGYTATLYVNGVAINTRHFEWGTTNTNWYYSRMLNISGSLFNAPSGQNKVTIEVKSLTNYYLYSNESVVNSNKQKSVLNIIGYPSMS